jgi:hypothetical protein
MLTFMARQTTAALLYTNGRLISLRLVMCARQSLPLRPRRPLRLIPSTHQKTAEGAEDAEDSERATSYDPTTRKSKTLLEIIRQCYH